MGVRRYRHMTSVAPPVIERCVSCDTADITVCGRRDADQRMRIPDDRTTLTGQSGAAQANCIAESGRPCVVCPPTGCTGVNLFAIPFKVFRIVQALVDPNH
ncbi:hypothetical protein EAH87_01220 [Sphingomonas koreensis]|nr:hypothetical protein EAH87_01220 [Sphingomonas koreensis]